MPDIWTIYNATRGPFSVFWQIFKEKPAESLTALLLLIGLVLDRFYRRKKLVLEVIHYKDHPQGDIEKELVFRIINAGNKEVYLRSKGVGTINVLKTSPNHPRIRADGYRYEIYENEETLVPGKSIRVEVLEWQNDHTGGIAYMYAIDQTGRQWKRFLNLKTEIRYCFLKTKNFLVKLVTKS